MNNLASKSVQILNFTISLNSVLRIGCGEERTALCEDVCDLVVRCGRHSFQRHTEGYEGQFGVGGSQTTPQIAQSNAQPVNPPSSASVVAVELRALCSKLGCLEIPEPIARRRVAKGLGDRDSVAMAVAAGSVREAAFGEDKCVIASDLPCTAAMKRDRNQNMPGDPIEVNVREVALVSGSALRRESGIKALKVVILVDNDEVSGNKARLNR